MLPTAILAFLNPSGLVFGFCCAVVILLPLSVAIGAVILRAAVKWLLKFDLAFGYACLVVILNSIAGGIAGFIIRAGIGLAFGLIGGVNPRVMQAVSSIINLPVGFLISSLIHGLLIKYPGTPGMVISHSLAAPSPFLAYQSPSDFGGRSGQPIGFVKGMLVTLVIYAIAICIAIVLGGIVLGVLLVTRGKF